MCISVVLVCTLRNKTTKIIEKITSSSFMTEKESSNINTAQSSSHILNIKILWEQHLD